MTFIIGEPIKRELLPAPARTRMSKYSGIVKLAHELLHGYVLPIETDTPKSAHSIVMAFRTGRHPDLKARQRGRTVYIERKHE